MASYTINVNGKTETVEADGNMPLLWVLRDKLNLKGTKFGCGVAACGACTVHLDGKVARACVTPVCSVGAPRLPPNQEDRQTKAGQAGQEALPHVNAMPWGCCQARPAIMPERCAASNMTIAPKSSAMALISLIGWGNRLRLPPMVMSFGLTRITSPRNRPTSTV